jgi:hypothetical protein
MQPQQPYPAYGYPQQPYAPPPPPPRRRTGLIVAIVAGCLALAGGVVALVLVLSDKDSEDSSSSGSGNAAASGSSSGKAPKSSATKPVQAPPNACDLLSPPQLAAILPGKIKEPFSREPEHSGEGQVETLCSWTNDPFANGQRFPKASLQLRVTATSTEDVTQTVFKTAVQCDNPASARIQVTGADEACRQHTSFDTQTKAPAGATKVGARRGTVVVELNYWNSGLPIEALDNMANSGTAAVLAVIPQPR